jgi:hypothetical protein
MTFFRETTEQYAHRQNLARYRRLLDTDLTAEERRFVERRVAEEQAPSSATVLEHHAQ